MSDNNAPLPWNHIYKTLVRYAPLWGGAVVLFTGFGMASALFSRDYWSASQPLVLRDEATGSVERLGRFGSQTQMKAAQETILEMATNFDVVRKALEQIGPADGAADPHWPTIDDVNGVAQKRVTVRAAQGSELGSTEVIYLSVQATSPERSRQFCNAVYESLTERLRTVRRLRADSIMEELVQARDLARQKLDRASAQLREIEVEFGSDLGELRNLSETFGDGANRRLLDETQRELQAAELELEQLEALHSLLVGGREDPNRLLISGGELLSSQPSLLKMKDGLIEAQLQQSQLSGRYTSLHPRMRAAIETEGEIRQQIRTESAAVVKAMQPSLQLGRDKVARLRAKQKQLNTRLTKVAGVRTQYAALAAEVKHRTQLLEQAEEALTEAQASRAAALSVNLLAEVGPPVVSDSPVGTSGSLLTLGSATAGLMFGLGAVFLIAPGPNEARRGRRWSDLIGGRRATDQPTVATPSATAPTRGPQPSARGFDRRAADRAPAPQPIAPVTAPMPSAATPEAAVAQPHLEQSVPTPETKPSLESGSAPGLAETQDFSGIAFPEPPQNDANESESAKEPEFEPTPAPVSEEPLTFNDEPEPTVAAEPAAVEAADEPAEEETWAATVFTDDPLNKQSPEPSELNDSSELIESSEPAEISEADETEAPQAGRDAQPDASELAEEEEEEEEENPFAAKSESSAWNTAVLDTPPTSPSPTGSFPTENDSEGKPALEPIVYRDVYEDDEEPLPPSSDAPHAETMSFSQMSEQLGGSSGNFPGDRRKNPRDE
ncbi:GumC family protein [Roseimaritima ulvae]|uniref:Chain length determinant protein n=1 Tax=Roseimaritima ulvae TaxID=980254 RepID=A0A5B9QRS0_9BACT|nr:hypothetical protein [Roseimaritima ulvae]QEG40609.1 hypothetical protein UC8_26250 [Roseimaritima ulvae]